MWLGVTIHSGDREFRVPESYPLNAAGSRIDEKGNKSKEWAYIGKSIIKLQNLGIIELDYINTTGNINSLNVERFHITLFGNEMLKYIK